MLKELLEKRGKLNKRMQDLVNKVKTEKRAWSQEDETAWAQMIAEDNDLKGQIERQERLDLMAADLNRQERHGVDGNRFPGSAVGDLDTDEARNQGPTELERRSLFNAWGRRQAGVELSERERQLCKKFRFNPSQREIQIRLVETEHFTAVCLDLRATHPQLHQQRRDRFTRDMSVGTPSAGGYTIPAGFVNSLEMAMLYFGPMFQTSEVIRTDSGNDLPWPTANDTSNEGALLTEASSISTSVDPTIGVATYKAYKYSSKPILVSQELIEDTAFNIDTILGGILGERLGRIANKQCTTGTGSSQPQGIVVGSTAGKTTASASAIAATELMDLQHSVDVAYRGLPGAGFMMHDNIVLYIRKLVDSNGQFIFQPGLQLGIPDRLLGHPLFINNHMQSSVATATKTVLFGWLPAYKIRQVRTIRLRRLTERYADTDQVAFIAFARLDGRLLDAGTHPVKHLLQA